MSVRAVRTYSIIIVIVCLVASLLYFIIVPWQNVSAYHRIVGSGARILGQALRAVEQTTEAPAFSEPDIALDERRRGLTTTLQVIDAAQAGIVQYEAQTAQYTVARYTGVMPVYADARYAKQSVEYMVAQSQDVLEDYRTVVTFVDGATKAEQVLRRHMDEINAVRDLNELAGQFESVYRRAREVRDARAELDRLVAPQEFSHIKSALIERCGQLAAGLDALAYGLEVAIDTHIYDAVAVIERVTGEYDSSDRWLVYDGVNGSKIFKSVTELHDKLRYLEKLGLPS